MTKTLGLIGVPTSMGAFAPGQEKGPAALRDANLLGRLSTTGVEVADHGDGEVRRWGQTRTTAAHRTQPP
jgi:arginase